MAHPAEFFVKYLLVVGSALNHDEVNTNLEIHGLSEISEVDLERCKLDIEKLPADFRPWDSKHRPTVSWLRKKKLYSLVFPDKHTEQMREKILLSPVNRERVETFILGGVPFFDISNQIGARHCGVQALLLELGHHGDW